MNRKSAIAMLLLCLSLLGLSACETLEERQARETMTAWFKGGDLEKAERLLRLDDYRQFQQAEINFITLRLKDRDNPILAGWLAQLYVAWTEQLRSEIHFLKRTLTAAEIGADVQKKAGVLALLDLRRKELADADEGARSLGNVLMTHNADTYIGHRAMADYYRIMGDHDKMEEELAKVRKLNPNSVGLRFVEGAGKARFEHDYPAAIRLFDQALAMDPMFLKALYFKGLAQDAMGERDAARATMLAVLAKSPNHPGAQTYLGLQEYLALLDQEARTQMEKSGGRYFDSDQSPRLVTWKARMENGAPVLDYRLGGPTGNSSEIKAVFSLLNDRGAVIGHVEQSFRIPAGAVHAGKAVFDSMKSEGAPKSVILQILTVGGGEDPGTTVDVRRAEIIGG